MIIEYINLSIADISPRKLAQTTNDTLRKKENLENTSSRSYFDRFPHTGQVTSGTGWKGYSRFNSLYAACPWHNLRKARADSGRAYQSRFRRASNRRRMEEIRAVVRTILSTYLSRASFGQRDRERDFVLIRVIVLGIRWDPTIYRGKSRDVNIPVAVEGRNTES